MVKATHKLNLVIWNPPNVSPDFIRPDPTSPSVYLEGSQKFIRDPNAVGLRYVAVLIRGKRKGELEFLLELVVACDRVARDAHDLDLNLGEVGEGVSKGAGLGGTAWRVVARIEIKHNGLALEPLERNRAAAIGGQGELRCLVAYLKAYLLSS